MTKSFTPNGSVMIKKLVLFLGVLIISGVSPTLALAQRALPDPGSESYFGETLCLPDAYMQTSPDCLPLGPSQYLTDLARAGIEYPFTPLPVTLRDPELNKLEYKYARINVMPPEQAPVYSTVDDALSGGAPVTYIPAGYLLYVSYKDRYDVGSAHYVFLRRNVWMRASPAEYKDFQGLIFQDEPAYPPGWIIDQARARVSPGYLSPEIGEVMQHGKLVTVYAVQRANDTDWYMIGINRWVERRYIRVLEIMHTPPEGITNGRWIDINLYQQTLSVYEDGQLRYATLIASGLKPFYTRPGLFKISEKKPIETMSSGDLSDYYYLEDVPWTMYFDKRRAIHGAYWRAMFGFPQSHGCVNMSVGDARWVYEWANEGDWVYVHDPSGETPTDDAAYTDGGA